MRKFFVDFFGHVRKRLVKRTNVSFRIFDVKAWETNNYNTNTAHHLKK